VTRPGRTRLGKPTCSLCRRRQGDETTAVLHFWLTRYVYREDGRQTMRGCGAIDLCERCWARATAASRIRRRPERIAESAGGAT
jgi:hypothetical protein